MPLEALPIWLAMGLGTLIIIGLMALGMWSHSKRSRKLEDEIVAQFKESSSVEVELKACIRLLRDEQCNPRMADGIIKRAKERARRV